MAHQTAPGGVSLTNSIFGGPSMAATIESEMEPSNTAGALTNQILSNTLSPSNAPTPRSDASSNNTYIMSNSPTKGRPVTDGYRPKITRTLGQRPACLVNASVTYCGNNHIYAFGGFDQYSDEVYNHVLKLDLASHQWSLVDNYGDIPGVRMGKPEVLE